jgi:hypothetical protein
MMSSKKKELYCGDTLNTLGHEDQEFQWSREYNYYKALSPAREKDEFNLDFRIALVGCVLEVTYFKEVVQWCAYKFNCEKRMIQLQGHQPISLAPSIF